MKALKLIKFDKNNKSKPSEDAKKFFSALDSEILIVVISICGLTRSGKSTLLNILIREFKNERLDHIKERFKAEFNDQDTPVTEGMQQILIMQYNNYS